MMPIATPLASKKQLTLIQKAIENSEVQITGIKACTKEINKGSKGIVILTADTSPMDLITHIPALCEEKGLKYIFVETKEDLKNTVTCIFIKKENAEELYESLK